jgi:4-amino-4-deoxy-L-arabinose transferase-like glycosyltransferase
MPNLIATEARPSWKLDPRQHLLVGVVFVVALAVRGVYLWGQSQTNPLFDHPIMDARVHHDWARQIASGEGWDERPYFRAPLYYYTLALLYKLFGGSVAVGRVAGCVLGAATCYLIARLGIVLGGFRAGLLAGIIAAAYWPFIYFDAEPLTVGLEVLLDVALLLLLTLAARHRALWLFLVCGVIWGLSQHARVPARYPDLAVARPAPRAACQSLAGPGGTGLRGRRSVHPAGDAKEPHSRR